MPKITTIKIVTKKWILIHCCRRYSWWSIFVGKPLRCSIVQIIILGNIVNTSCGGRSSGWSTILKFNYVGNISDLLLIVPFMFVV
jgi:hypothetical protein